MAAPVCASWGNTEGNISLYTGNYAWKGTCSERVSPTGSLCTQLLLFHHFIKLTCDLICLLFMQNFLHRWIKLSCKSSPTDSVLWGIISSWSELNLLRFVQNKPPDFQQTCWQKVKPNSFLCPLNFSRPALPPRWRRSVRSLWRVQTGGHRVRLWPFVIFYLLDLKVGPGTVR